MLAGAGVAPNSGITTFDRKSTKSPQFDTITTRQGIGDFIKNSVYDILDIAQIKMRIALGDLLNEF
jgi:hypothetical protein